MQKNPNRLISNNDLGLTPRDLGNESWGGRVNAKDPDGYTHTGKPIRDALRNDLLKDAIQGGTMQTDAGIILQDPQTHL